MRRKPSCLLWTKSGYAGPFERSVEQCGCARQNHFNFGELAWLRIDLDRATMLLHNYVVTDGEPKAGSFAGGLCCKERVEHLFSNFRWNTGAVIPNSDFHTIAKASCRGHHGWFVAIAVSLGSTLCCRIKAVREQVQKHPRDILGKYVGLASGRVECRLHGTIEALFLSSCTVIGEIEAFLDQGIDIDDPVFPRAFARVQQHVLDDGIGTLAVLHDLVEIAPQRIRQFGDLGARLLVDR